MAEIASSGADALAGVIWESKRIISSHSRHFLALSVLFLLPLSLLLIALPSFYSSLLDPLAPPSSLNNPPSRTLLRLPLSPSASPPSASAAVPYLLLYASAAALLAVSASASVSHSSRRGFFGRPVRLLSALCSLPASLLRLVITLFTADLILCAFLVLPVSFFILSLHALNHFGIQHFSLALCGAAAVGYAVLVLYVQVNWLLAAVIAVVESSWGFEPLRRSMYLVKGMRRVALSLFLFFAAGIGLMLWAGNLGTGVVEVTRDWKVVAPVVTRIVCASAVIVLLLLYNLVSSVVLYMYCKALHGELADEIAEEFAQEYVYLPYDDMKNPHIVSVMHC